MKAAGFQFAFTVDVNLFREPRDRQVAQALEVWCSSRKKEAFGKDIVDDPMTVIRGKIMEAFGPKPQQASFQGSGGGAQGTVRSLS